MIFCFIIHHNGFGFQVSKFKNHGTILQKLLSAEQKLNESNVAKINDMNNGIHNLSKELEAESNNKINVQTSLMEKENENVLLKEKLETAEKEFYSMTQYMTALNQKLLEVETFQANLSDEKKELINEVIISLSTFGVNKMNRNRDQGCIFSSSAS